MFPKTKAVLGLLKELKTTGTTAGFLDRILSFDERQERVGLPQVIELERRFGTKPVGAGKSC